MRRGRVAAVAGVAGVLLAGSGLGLVVLGHGDRDGHRVDVERSPLTFEIPRGWTEVTRPQDPSQAWVIQAAEQQGYTPRQYVDLLRKSTRATLAGPGVDGRAQTIDVQDSDFEELPTTSAVESRVTALHEEVVGSRVVRTKVGTAVVTRYRVPLGAETITSDGIYIAVGGEVLTITVGAAREDVVTPLTDQVLRTLDTD